MDSSTFFEEASGFTISKKSGPGIEVLVDAYRFADLLVLTARSFATLYAIGGQSAVLPMLLFSRKRIILNNKINNCGKKQADEGPG